MKFIKHFENFEPKSPSDELNEPVAKSSDQYDAMESHTSDEFHNSIDAIEFAEDLLNDEIEDGVFKFNFYEAMELIKPKIIDIFSRKKSITYEEVIDFVDEVENFLNE